jgi:hypothetical protein
VVQPFEYVEQVVPEPIDLAVVRLEDERREQEGAPYRFAIPNRVGITPDTNGTWEHLDDETLLWRLQITSPEALSLNLGFTRYFMPPDGSLFIYAANHTEVLDPFTDEDNERHGQLWTPLLHSDDIVMELTIPASQLGQLQLELGSINHGYRGLKPLVKDKGIGDSAWCNVNAACPEGDPWRNQIRSIAMVTYGGSAQCTGALLNNTANDCKPYFLTAYHCGIDVGVAPTIVVYWKYETSTCGGTTGPLSYNQTGAIFRSSHIDSDFALVELDDDPDPAFNVYFAGWDRGTAAPSSGVAIHHPKGDLKKISFEYDPVTITSYAGTSSPGNGTHLRVADWDYSGTDEGTTEQGSSGCPLFNQDKRVVGQLHGGLAACGNDKADWFGRFYKSWTGGGTPSTRLSDWLDPIGSGVTSLDGMDCGCLVTSPDDDCVGQGSVLTIMWDSECNSGDDVKIELYKGDLFERTITADTDDDGSYDWPVPDDDSLTSDCDYRVKITSTLSSACYCYSSYFCIAAPPRVQDISVFTTEGSTAAIALVATDEGCPESPGVLAYSITSLPGYGNLSDPCAGAITDAPYTLAGNGDKVVFTPEPDYLGLDSFQFKADDGGSPPSGGDSNVATVSISVGGAIYAASMDNDPGWSASGEWQWGEPAGQGGLPNGNPDPLSGYTGLNVYGINLNGDYSTAVRGPYYLSTQAIDCSEYSDVHLRFYRWLNSDYQPYVYATVEVSNDGSTWAHAWENDGPPAVTDDSWQFVEYDISSVANNQPTMYIRWGHRVARGSARAYSGWNIDEVEVTGRRMHMVLGDFGLDNLWMYQNLPGKSNSDLTASVSITDDPWGNSSYSYEWEIVLPADVSLAPVTVDGGGAGDAYWTFAARGCDEPGGLSDSGQTFTVRVTVTGDDYGNTGQAEVEFGIALLGDVNNDAIINVADRSIANVFWRTGSAGPYTLRDCDVNSDGIINMADRSIANAVWRGVVGQKSVSTPCPLR